MKDRPSCALCTGGERLLQLQGTESPGAQVVREIEQRRAAFPSQSYPPIAPLAELRARIARIRKAFT